MATRSRKAASGGRRTPPRSRPRTLWKGAINFGLVHVPVGLYSAAKNVDIDFDWLDRRSMKPVGYKRINKETGKEVPKEDIVRGYQYEDDRYVVMSDEEIRAANVKATRSVDIFAFVDPEEIPPVYLDTPYYLAPIQRGEKVYALLRETLRQTKKIGIANVVIATKQHLAALIPSGPVLMLNTLRWASELRSFEELELPGKDLKSMGIRDQELSMARQLVEEMSEKWDPGKYRDAFRDDIMALVERKIKAGETETVTEVTAGDVESRPSNVIDLTQLLKRSLHGGRREAAAAAAGKKASSRHGRQGEKPAAKRKRA